MIERRLSEITGTERKVKADNWTSRRLILRDDGPRRADLPFRPPFIRESESIPVDQL